MSHGAGSNQMRRMQRRDRITGWVLPLLMSGGVLLVLTLAQVWR